MSWISVIFLLAGLGLLIGFAGGLLIAGPLLIYSLPYLAWLGWNSGSNGVPNKLESDNLPALKKIRLHAKNATKLYRSWIKKQPHGITNF